MRAQNLLCGYIAENYADHDMVVVSPDSAACGSREVGRRTERRALAFIHKTRDPLVPNQVKSDRVVGDVTASLRPDRRHDRHRRHHRRRGEAATGRRRRRCHYRRDARCPLRSGAPRLAACGAREVIVTNTLPIGEDKRFPQLTVLSIAPLLASTIRAVFENGSVTGLFDGSA